MNVAGHGGSLGGLSAAILLNVYVWYRLARPVAGVGIMMPALVPALVALPLTTVAERVREPRP